MLFWLPAPLPVLGVVYLMVGGVYSAAGWTILLAACVGVGTLLLAMVVQPTPLPEGLSPPVSARRSLHRFRQFTGLRIALALVPVFIGAAASVVGGGMYPVFASLALAWPQMLLAIPTFFTITRARRAMEAWGTTAYLWHALSRPAKVTWPIITPLAKWLRRWRAERAVAQRTARREAELRRSEEREQEEAWQGPDDEANYPGAGAHVLTGSVAAASVVEERADRGWSASDPADSDRASGDGATGAAADDRADTDADQPADSDPGRGAGGETEETGPGTGAPAPAVGSSRSTASAPAALSGVHQGTRQPREPGGGAPGRTTRRPRRSQSSRRPHSNKP